MARILVVDDEKNIQTVFRDFLEQDGHEVHVAGNVGDAVHLLGQADFDVMVSDILMPDISGIDLLEHVRKVSPDVQVIMITGQPALETAVQSVRAGAFDYLSKPVSGADLRNVVTNAARTKSLIDEKRRLEADNLKYRKELEALVEARTKKLHSVNDQLVIEIQERKDAENQLRQVLTQQRRAIVGIIKAMGMVIEKRDPGTAGHQTRVAKLAVTIAKDLGLSEDQQDSVYVAAVIHDLGKIFIPTDILSKAANLMEQEYALVKMHPQIGYEILKPIEFPWPIPEIILQHHERINGSGYPRSLKADEILLEAKILAVADVVEAMASNRPHRAAPGVEKALEEIIVKKQVLFDPEIVDSCVRVFRIQEFSFD